MHKTQPVLTDQQLSDLATAVRTRIDWLTDRIITTKSELLLSQYPVELERQHALFVLLVGAPYVS